jgi:hypothetical protein
MPQGLIGSNLVLVLTANLLSFDDPAGFEIGDDPLNRTLGDANLQRNFAEHD